MPIYAYKCSTCGHAKDVLQKISDAPLTDCPECGASTFSKQVTAAGFQLKGSGWYVTDFRNNGSGGANGAKSGGKEEGTAPATGEAAGSGDGAAAKGGDAKSSGAAATPAAAPAPAAPASSTPSAS
ncbi:FmdB family zinc ribbon protein [Bordetella flabilis]|uniref:FmdB family transcriptional regulator n=1 Tax=Bordetella flabilis TaxID=463014 RepID=A0A193GK18_9BORD|nr:FmdB family zinc ribbon protein [Bordetella flabilis]ANN79933.1 FmdB family transcriptional regulator [Bordetella flabilis]